MKEKLFDTTAAILSVAGVLLIGALAMASSFGVPVSRVPTLTIFAGLFVIGLALVGMGVYQLLVVGRPFLFGSCGLVSFGLLLVFMANAGYSGLAGYTGTYRNFLENHFMWLAGIACALIALHVFLERPRGAGNNGGSLGTFLGRFLTLVPEDEPAKRQFTKRVVASFVADMLCFMILLMFDAQLNGSIFLTAILGAGMIGIAIWQFGLALDWGKQQKGRQMFAVLAVFTLSFTSFCIGMAVVEIAFRLPQPFMRFLTKYVVDLGLFLGLCLMAQCALSYVVAAGKTLFKRRTP